MGRDVDERKKRAALRKLRKAAELAEQGKGPPLSDWEREFLEEVEERIEKYGSAFADPMKGNEGEALSALQQVKLKEIDKKARGKARKGFGNKARPGRKSSKGSFAKRAAPRVRQIDDDIEEDGALNDLGAWRSLKVPFTAFRDRTFFARAESICTAYVLVHGEKPGP